MSGKKTVSGITVNDSGSNITVARNGAEDYISIPFLKKEKFFSDSGDYVEFMKACEKTIRGSQEYSRYIAYLKKDVGLRNCALFHNIDDSIAPIEMHHGPIFTLYDIVEIQISYMYKQGWPINTFYVADNVLADHFENIIQVVMLCQMAHKGVHNFIQHPSAENAGFFLSTKSAFGDFKKFVEKYSDALTFNHVRKIKNYLKLEEEYSKKNNKALATVPSTFKISVTEYANAFQ